MNAILIKHSVKELSSTSKGATYKISIQIPMSYGWIERVKFYIGNTKGKKVLNMEYVKSDEDYSYFELDLELETQAIYSYYFSYEANGVFYHYKQYNYTDNQSIIRKECWKLAVNFKVPDWAQGAIMYHVFVDRYRRGSTMPLDEMPNRKIHQSWNELPVLGPDEDGLWNVDFFGGDLKGIEETLDYIKSLGVSIIYLSPIVKSQSNHRYDTANYYEVDPYAGTNESLKSLCDHAHKKGMKVILDAVFNHTGNDSIYFNEYGRYDSVGAFQSKDSEYYDFYKKYWNCGRMEFAYWWGMKNLPECDGSSEKWRDFILGEGGVIDFWFSLGIDGLRLDVADELSDEFIEGIRVAAKRNKPDAFIVGEVWKNPMRMHRGYIESGKGMDTVMNYQIVNALLRYFMYSDVYSLEMVIDEIMTEYPEETINSLMNFTSTHDISRIIELFMSNESFKKCGEWAWNLQNESIEWVRNYSVSIEQYKYARNVLKTYLYALAFLPGTFSIFYGDEVGVCGIGNLINRAPYPWNRRDKNMLKFFRELLAVRKSEEFLKTAALDVKKISEKQFVFERFKGENSILIATSRTHDATELVLPEEYKDAKVLIKKRDCSKTSLAPYGAIVLKK